MGVWQLLWRFLLHVYNESLLFLSNVGYNPLLSYLVITVLCQQLPFASCGVARTCNVTPSRELLLRQGRLQKGVLQHDTHTCVALNALLAPPDWEMIHRLWCRTLNTSEIEQRNAALRLLHERNGTFQNATPHLEESWGFLFVFLTENTAGMCKSKYTRCFKCVIQQKRSYVYDVTKNRSIGFCSFFKRCI